MTARVLSRIGIIVAVFGIIDLIWTQISSPFASRIGNDVAYRFAVAEGPVQVFALGIIIVAAAEILAVISRTTSI